ncbi:uncharacterized protein KY384_002603 [Bacidia gigantensis]|uniref:uncharacterized protein n=1 Tax=Bacidia gigantensis TaxID=2732470 RepID=UPI001D05A2ED|nr:uncharacterized protein KY384_002603 [Bacidia gigantensis]KAG8532726.1 hypothetical protein KY384_002603 [Bacidia gigantensis]
MPRIDVLPTASTSVAKAGYALVPDTRGQAPLAAQPVSGRKRTARASGLGGGDTTARQQSAALKHLAELDKDGHKDVQIPVPKDVTARGANLKMTTNVRRILTSQKTFANHLADEEATISQHAQNTLSSAASAPRRTSTTAKAEMSASAQASPPRDPLANEPLLKSYVPEAPSAEEMEALVNAPPLSHGAACAVLPDHSKPQRHFCEICGYWGTIKCIRCGARVCGLECKGAHDDGRCLKFYA